MVFPSFFHCFICFLVSSTAFCFSPLFIDYEIVSELNFKNHAISYTKQNPVTNTGLVQINTDITPTVHVFRNMKFC